jgi:hypothetical protein
MKGCWRVGLALLLADCHATGNWSKPGVEASAAAHEYEDCRAIAAEAVKPETGIDEDILATRQAEIGRSSIARIGAHNLREETGDRAAAIVTACMKAKGFAPGPASTDQPRR